MFVPTPCACCLSTVVLASLGCVALFVFSIGQLLAYTLPKQKLGLKIYKGLSTLLNLIIVVVAIFFGVLTTNEDVRNYTFYKIIERGAVYPNPMDDLRCANIRNLSGRVLEIGPGPGTNFRCWQNNTAITEWVGVEPNPFFKEKLTTESQARNITFPMRTVWLKGENVDVDPGTFDYVVGTHVLCSVDDVYAVLRQVSRALKPLGTYHFMEHVAARESSTLHTWQQIFAPIFHVVGNGCKFKTLWNDLSSTAGLVGFDVNLEFVDASAIVPIPLIAPHITGTAVKKAAAL
mmetsp:Transcript_67846/g.133462  ORF Transcript_67846/g.133462 Transcript_67846/m.133462 type:complete len:290 (-) Transcript_67846:83-952(-)